MKRILVVAAYLLGAVVLLSPAEAHAQNFDPQVEALLEEMSPEERIGQLMIVTFFGSDVSQQADIARLVQEYHIGGVMIRPENNNLTSEAALASELNGLTRRLQTLNREENAATPYIPLLIGVDLGSSDWYTLTETSPALTPLPSNMAVGATWRPDLARQVGAVAGEELSALGVNLVLGPVADVVTTPPPSPSGDLGTLAFGGDPYWVGEMTAYYVEGLHDGAEGKILVAPRHFPGYGSADRLASEEIPNVQRSLDQLNEVDLVPFYRVTSGAETQAQQADGLVTGHIVFRGLQTEDSRPVSLDPNALNTLLAQEGIAEWYEGGGLVISDSLGLRGVQIEYGFQAGASFPSRAIALDAFEAGNDLLYLGNFGANPPADQTATVIDTLEYFLSRYEQDIEFRERTDEAVRRILAKKLALYDGSFRESSVLPNVVTEEGLETEQTVASIVANEGMTLLSPLTDADLRQPVPGERVVIFSDIRSFSQCATCTARSLIGAGELQASILRLYGPQGSNDIGFADISSYTFDQLAQYLQFGGNAGPSGQSGLDDLGVSLANADWVILAMINEDTDVYATADVVSAFLAERPVGFDTRIVAIAAGAPYYLDATEVSKLAAYYALYDTSSPFIDAAATALFRQLPLDGDAPVSVPSVDYLIQEVTQPDPQQVIPLLYCKIEEEPAASPGDAPPCEPGQEPLPPIALGEEIFVQAMVEDSNGRPVKDGTRVNFIVNYVATGDAIPEAQRTSDGVASFRFTRDSDELIFINATSPPATQSLSVQIDDFSIGLVTPQPTSETTPEPTTTPAPTPQAEAEADEGDTPPAIPMVRFGDLFFTMLGLTSISVGIFVLNILREDLNTALLMALPVMIIGIVAYNYYALQLPGAIDWRNLLMEVTGNTQWAAGSAAWTAALITFGLIQLTLVVLRGQQSGNHRRE